MADFFENLVYADTDVITFPSGIPGFEEKKKFVLSEIAEFKPFEWLACIDGSRLRFAVIHPLLFRPDYDPKITKAHIQELQLEKPDDVLMYTIVTIRENPIDSTANLIGPIIINKVKKLGKQIIVEDDRYTTQEPILRNE
jgi:flagellar assembly factor FliW